jgi:hypothetical protein
MQDNYKKPYKKNWDRKPLTPEEKFEKMLKKFLKTSNDKLKDMAKSTDKKRPNKSYKLGSNRNEKADKSKKDDEE